MALLYPNLSAAVADISHPNWRGSAIGIYRFWRDLGYGIGALGLGIAAHFSGSWSGILVRGRLDVPVRCAAVVARRRNAPATESGARPTLTLRRPAAGNGGFHGFRMTAVEHPDRQLRVDRRHCGGSHHLNYQEADVRSDRSLAPQVSAANQCSRYAAWQATHCCMTVPSAASAGRTSLLTLAVCASTANRLAARCICVPMSCIACGMKGAICAAP